MKCEFLCFVLHICKNHIVLDILIWVTGKSIVI